MDTNQKLLERIKSVVKDFGGVEKFMDVFSSKSQYYRIINDETSLKAIALIKLAKKTGVSLDWLATGKPPIMEGVSVPVVERPYFYADEDQKDEYIIKYYKIPVDDIDSSGKYIAMFSRLTSMSPLINKGDIILINLNTKNHCESDIYLFEVDNELQIRKYELKNNGMLLKGYEGRSEIFVPKNSINKNFRILGCVSKVVKNFVEPDKVS